MPLRLAPGMDDAAEIADVPKDVRAAAVRRVRERITLQHDRTGQPVVVVPVLVASGKITREVAGTR